VRLGVDASNIRAGGGLTHLGQILAHARPADHGVASVVVFGGARTLEALPAREWLEKAHVARLDGGGAGRLAWQQLSLGRALAAAGCDALLSPGGTLPSNSSLPGTIVLQNMLPFEKAEAARFGLRPIRARYALLRFAQLRSMRRARGIVFLSEYAKRRVGAAAGRARALTAVVPHGVEPRFFAARAGRPRAAGAPWRLLYVSIVNVYKHQDAVAEAVIRLRRRGVPVELDLVGPAYPPALERLRRRIAVLDPGCPHIRIRGQLPFAALHEVYAAADAFVFASSCENMPNILLEAMAAGLPIASSDRGPMPEILGDAGLYFDPESPQAIEEAVGRLHADPGLCERLAGRAQARAREFSWERAARETFALLARVQAGSGGRG
jgi:glycosyltransferase involved in cell wall biosynthesis